MHIRVITREDEAGRKGGGVVRCASVTCECGGVACGLGVGRGGWIGGGEV